MSPQPLWFLDTLVRVLVPHEGGADGMSLIESTARRGDSPPLHRHATEDEAFYVLEGELTVQLGDEVLRAGPGEALLLPRGAEHTYRVDSEAARWLVLTRGGDFEAFVRRMARPAAYDEPEVKDDRVVSAFEPSVENGTPLPQVQVQSALLPPLGDALRRVVKGDASPQAALGDVATAYERLLSGYSTGPAPSG